MADVQDITDILQPHDDGEKEGDGESVHTDLDSKQQLEALDIEMDPKPKDDDMHVEQVINTIDQVLADLNQKDDQKASKDDVITVDIENDGVEEGHFEEDAEESGSDKVPKP